MAFKIIGGGMEDFLERHKKTLEALADPDKILRTAVANTYQTISERIQQRGERTDGRAIEAAFASSRATGKRLGAYSQGYSYIRQKDGRRIDKMDFTRSGDLLDRGFIFLPVGRDGYGLGFTNSEMAQRAEYLERRFGEVFSPSKQEREECFGFIIKNISDVLKKRN